MAITTAMISQKEGDATAVVLTFDGVELGKKGACKEFSAPEPFKKLDWLMEEFIQAGGKVFACRTCMAVRKLEFDKDMESFLYPASAPDLVRWLKNCTASIQLV